MCRIFGQFGQRKGVLAELQAASRTLKAGGPDSHQILIQDNWSLACNRLAVQGIYGGHQPYKIDQKIYAVYNGEIYNHLALRKRLRSRGYHIQDACDGAILPALYKEYGEDFVTMLEGMFAIAIVDMRDEPKLLLFSDPAGMKSLYYAWHQTDRTLYFASEIPALLAFKGVTDRIRFEAVDEVLTLRAICYEQTIFKDIKLMRPATMLKAYLGKAPLVIKSKQNRVDNTHINANSSADLLALLGKEISCLFKADVPVCLVTSGGLDSSLLTVLAAKHAEQLDTFHICYKGDWPDDERLYARQLAESIASQHHEIELDPDRIPEYVEKTIAKIGQPNTAPHNISTYALFEAIHAQGFKVAITGEGADEYFGGYTRFKTASESLQPSWLEDYLDVMGPCRRALVESLYSEDYKTYLNQHTEPLHQKLKERFGVLAQGQERLQHLLAYDQYERMPDYILRRVDHLSMAHAVESRMPFCQPSIRRFSRFTDTQNKINKRILFEAAQAVLPQAIVQRKKQPFTLPIAAMINKNQVVRDYVFDTLNSGAFLNRGIFCQVSVHQILQDHTRQPTQQGGMAIWCMLMLEAWFKRMADKPLPLTQNKRHAAINS